MREVDRKQLQEKLANRSLIQQALSKASREAVLSHAHAGNPIAIWQDDKVVWLQPEEVLALLAPVLKPGSAEAL